MNTKYSIKKVWYYLLCMIMTLQLIACPKIRNYHPIHD
ncbi:DUF4972 domain-containing protein [Bacteroides thetaiotaomicron]